MKYLGIFLSLVLALGGLTAAVNAHDRNVYMAGYNAHKNEVLQSQQAAAAIARQNSTLQHLSDQRRQLAAQTKQKKRDEHYAQIERETANNDKQNPDAYPADWQLNDADFQLLIRAINPDTRTGDHGAELGAVPGAGPAGKVAAPAGIGRPTHYRFARPDPRIIKAVLRQFSRPEKTHRVRARATAAG